MRKFLSIFLAVSIFISTFGLNETYAAGAKSFNYPYVGWNYDEEGQYLIGIIQALGNNIEQRPWQLKRWPAHYKFPSGTITKQLNYDVFNIKKKFETDNFSDENGFGLIHRSDESVKDFFNVIMKDEGKKVSAEQLTFFRDYVTDRSHNPSLKQGHPTFFEGDGDEMLLVRGVIEWMGGKFDHIEKVAENNKIAHYLESEWPSITKIVDSGCPIKIDFKTYGYTSRNVRVLVTAKGAFPDLTDAVSLMNKTTAEEVYNGTATGDCSTLREKFGDEVDIVLNDGYGRTAIKTIKLSGDGKKIDFVPTKLNLTEGGQLWMTFRYDGDAPVKTADILHKDGMPMTGTVKVGGTITTEFKLGMLYKQLPAELKPTSTYNVMLGKMDFGTKPGKYYIKVSALVNNPNHPTRALESPSVAYKNNEMKGEFIHEIKESDYDLFAINVTATPSNITDKQSTTVKASVKNRGPSAQKDVRIRFFSNGKQIYEMKKDMPANKTLQVGGFTYKPGSAGAYNISVHVDPLAEKMDKDRTNNVTSTGCMVTDETAAGKCSSSDRVQGKWDVTYPLITGYREKTSSYTWTDKDGHSHTSYYTWTDYNDPIWSSQRVSYQETLQVDGTINTKQGIATDPKKPKDSDRESRGSWDIIPWAKEKKLNPNEVTRAGYGFELKFVTTYSTDWETKVPNGYENTAKPIGTKPKGVQEATARIYDSAGKFVKRIDLDKTSDDGKKATFEFPIKSYKDSVSGKTYKERKFMTDYKAPDGIYKVVVETGPAGITGISSCKTFYVTIYGSMYEDVQNLGTKK
ncbi:CARDB domain-containing protein [Paenibacillus aceti]|uniref:CARDB domain-containing protein n=1 Tax=Paenibacillus aceti TaxID=1820010 RepID=UPI000EA06396|nr:CARDB domain-containing protein [Paenibacillus aceti]